jgi:FixJ family two-component response regulator
MTAPLGEVFVVDDDVSVCTALARLIGSAGHAVRTFTSAREFLERRDQLGPGCLVLDVRLPDLDGLELHRRLRESGSPTPVIFMTGFGDIPTSVRAMKSGAVDFLPKPVSDETLLGAIDAALAEEARARAEQVETQELSKRYESLTPREAQVLRLVLAGRLNKQIARELGISEKTVKVHRGRVMVKMGARRVALLVQFADRLGLGTASVETPRAISQTSWVRGEGLQPASMTQRGPPGTEAHSPTVLAPLIGPAGSTASTS